MKKRSAKELAGLAARGLAMGAADVVPGVSGGTIAFISGIYEELINSIKSVNLATLRLLFKGKFKDFWVAINGTFLIALFAGIAVSIVSLSRVISSIIEHKEETQSKVLLWAFFCGLIIASIIYVGKQIGQWSAKIITGLVIGTAFALAVSLMSPAQGSDPGLFYIFICGAIAISAMILPGISGSFILLLMGAYSAVFGALRDFFDAVKEVNMEALITPGITVVVFAVGCLTGLLSFSRLLSRMFEKAHDLTVSVLTGFLIGSIYKVWPWKITTAWRTNSDNIEVPFTQKSVLPGEFAAANGDHYLLPAIGCLVLGFGIVFALEFVGKKLADKQAVA